MPTIAAGRVVSILWPTDGQITITPGSAGRVSLNARGRDGSQSIAPREIYNAETITVSAGDTVILEAINTDATYTSPVSGDVAATLVNEQPGYGTELLPASGWASSGWSGSASAGWTHTPGNTSALSIAVPISTATRYEVRFTVDNRTAGQVDVSMGGQTWANGSGHKLPDGPDGAWAPETHYFGVLALNNTGALIFSPSSSFDGRISEISVKEVTYSTDALSTTRDSFGQVTVETRVLPSSALATFYGVGAGKYSNRSAQGATGFGVNALANNASGYYLTAVGQGALQYNGHGRANTAVGTAALQSNTSGDQNTAVGVAALRSNTTGFNNLAIGVEAMVYNTTGSYNVAVGPYDTLISNTTGSNNVAIGFVTMYYNQTGNNNTAIGHRALENVVSTSGHTAVGFYASNKATTGINTSVGYQAAANATTGTQNTVVGLNAAVTLTTGVNNCALGHNALFSATTQSYNTVVGSMALRAATSFSNTAIGYGAAYALTTGRANIAIGSFVELPSNTTDRQLNIGNLIFGRGLYDGSGSGQQSATPTTDGQVGVGVAAPSARLHLAAGAAAAGMAPLKLTSGTNLTTPENGAIEFDGSSVYITIGGVRKTFVLA